MQVFARNTEVDFVVVGSGGAGGVMAKQLATNGFTVVVLEQGPRLELENFRQRDELLKRQNRDRFPGLTPEPQSFRTTAEEKARPGGGGPGGSRVVGGGTLTYTGTSWRHHEVDFEERTKWGDIAGAALADWPITYAELEPYYTQAEWEIGYSGKGDGAPRSKPYPVPALPIKSSGVLFEQGARKLGLKQIMPVPLAILSQPHNGRNACVHCGICFGYGCHVGAKSSVANTVIPIAERTGRCEIRPDSYAYEVPVDANGRVTGVNYFDANNRSVFQKARGVVISGNAASTARLLLLSKSAQFPNGLANSSGLVGKYIMFGGNGGARGIFEHPLNDYKSVAVTRASEDFYDSDPKRGFFGGAHLDSRGPYEPIAYGLNGMLPDRPRWGAGFKQALQEDFTRTMGIQVFGTSLPVETNMVDLDPDLKDNHGLPAMRLTYKEHPDDLKMRQFMTDRAVEILKAAGATRVVGDRVNPVRGGAHIMGTTRMGNDPKTSVLNKNNRTHDVPNLWCVDGGGFVTSGRMHCTATIQALAFRAGDLIARSRGGTGSL